MHDNAIRHFRKNDSILFSYIGKFEWTNFSKSRDLFEDLCESIISQQLSSKAADSIFKRFKNLFPKQKITPQKLVKISDKKIRACGTSWAKVRSLKDLAQKVINKEILLDKLDSISDEEVVLELIKVKGIGPWTAEMFLMFALARENIFSHGDLGLKKAIWKIYKFRKEPTKKQIEKIVAKWSPYKTHACRILWKIIETR